VCPRSLPYLTESIVRKPVRLRHVCPRSLPYLTESIVRKPPFGLRAIPTAVGSSAGQAGLGER
jgi:hypothetical protein